MATYVLLLLYGLTITIISVSYAEDMVISYSPQLVYRVKGTESRTPFKVPPAWGEWDNCDQREYAIGVNAKVRYDDTDEPDITGVNGVCIYCAPLGETAGKSSKKCSSIAPDGDFTQQFNCSYLVTGFAVGIDKDVGYLKNYFGIASVRFFCSTGEHKNFYSSINIQQTHPAYCLPGQAVCGIRTQVDPKNRPEDQDKVGVMNIQLKCCDIVSPGLADSCTASDKWKVIKSCNNVKGSKPIECQYDTSLGTAKATMSSQTKQMMRALEAAKSASSGYIADFELIGLKSDFTAIAGETTGYDWNKELSDTFQSMTTTTSKFNVPAGIHTTIFQVVGTCGLYTVYSSTIVRIDTKDSGPAPVPKVLPSGILCDKHSTTTATNILNHTAEPGQSTITNVVWK